MQFFYFLKAKDAMLFTLNQHLTLRGSPLFKLVLNIDYILLVVSSFITVNFSLKAKSTILFTLREHF